jgi:hypothetical protein
VVTAELRSKSPSFETAQTKKAVFMRQITHPRATAQVRTVINAWSRSPKRAQEVVVVKIGATQRSTTRPAKITLASASARFHADRNFYNARRALEKAHDELKGAPGEGRFAAELRKIDSLLSEIEELKVQVRP